MSTGRVRGTETPYPNNVGLGVRTDLLLIRDNSTKNLSLRRGLSRCGLRIAPCRFYSPTFSYQRFL